MHPWSLPCRLVMNPRSTSLQIRKHFLKHFFPRNLRFARFLVSLLQSASSHHLEWRPVLLQQQSFFVCQLILFSCSLIGNPSVMLWSYFFVLPITSHGYWNRDRKKVANSLLYWTFILEQNLFVPSFYVFFWFRHWMLEIMQSSEFCRLLISACEIGTLEKASIFTPPNDWDALWSPQRHFTCLQIMKSKSLVLRLIKFHLKWVYTFVYVFGSLGVQ